MDRATEIGRAGAVDPSFPFVIALRALPEGNARMNRRDFLLGNATGAGVGVAAGFFGVPKLLGGTRADPDLGDGNLSFAQNGEDLILKQVLIDVLKVDKPDYIDIGAWEPIDGSNTYYFYRRGSRGVLVEPNPAKAKRLRAVRKGDVVVEAGIAGEGSPAEADYYVMHGDGQINTFDKDQAEKLQKKDPHIVERVVKMPLLNVNAVLAEHFKTAPALFSIDTEGMDLKILKTLDFKVWRPKVFIVESWLDNGAINEDIVAHMTAQGYVFRGGNIVNAVFVEKKLFV